MGETTSHGIPVKNALEIKTRKYKTSSERALEIINSVHGDGKLPTIPIKTAPNTVDWLGAYSRNPFTDDSMKILLADNSEFTLIHEIGHFLDHKGFPGKGLSSINSILLNPILKAAQNSKTLKLLKKEKMSPGYRKYVFSKSEIWARIYVQYITDKSNNNFLRSQLNKILQNKKKISIITAVGRGRFHSYKKRS